jgi:hypothetical protein
MAKISFEEYEAKKKTFTRIPHDEFVKIAKELGLEEPEDKAGWLKFKAGGSSKQRIYVPKTKGVARIDIAETMITGHEDEIVNRGGENNGRVHQNIRFDRPAEDIKATFSWLCKELGSLEALAVKERAKPVALPGTPAEKHTGDVTVVAALTPQEEINKLVAKRALIAGTAEKMGKPEAAAASLAKIDAKLAELGYVAPEAMPAAPEAPAAE